MRVRLYPLGLLIVVVALLSGESAIAAESHIHAVVLGTASVFQQPAPLSAWTFDPRNPCPEALEIAKLPAFQGIDPTPLISRLLHDGVLHASLGPSRTAPSRPFNPAKLLPFPVNVHLINTIRGENTTVRRMASGMPDIYVVELLKKDTGPAPAMLTSSTTMPINQRDAVSQGRIAFRDVADLSGITDVTPGSVAAVGEATVQLVRIPLGRGVTFIPISQTRLFLAKFGNVSSATLTPGAGVGLEIPVPDDEALRLSVAAGPTMEWNKLTKDPRFSGVASTTFVNVELLLF